MNLLEMIKFEVACTLLEIRTKFNLQNFKQIKDLNQQVEYAKQNLQLVGEGSSRIVFLLSNRYVLKIAHPNAVEKGIAQNKAEVDVFTNPKVKSVISAIYSADPNYKWIMSEIVRPLKSQQEFEEMAGISWDWFVTATRNPKQFNNIVSDEVEEKQATIAQMQRRLKASADDLNAQKTIQTKIERLVKAVQNIKSTTQNQTLLGAINLINTAGVMPGDINEWAHWGKTADNRLVLYDYGFTKDVVHLYKGVSATNTN